MSDRKFAFPHFTEDRPIRFGIIGCGWFGRVHAERLSAQPGVQITALSDPNPEMMNQVLEKIPEAVRPAVGVRTFTDWNELISSGLVDAISINSPNLWHVQQCIAGLESGLHVLCEKPLSLIQGEAESVVAARDKASRLVAVSYQSRYHTDQRELHGLLHSGEFGRIKTVSVVGTEDWYRPNIGTWRHDAARCPGGFFGDANSHQLDVLFWMTGLQPLEIRAHTDKRGTQVPIVTWGEAVLAPIREEQPSSGSSDDSIPMSFMFAGDAHYWSEEIRIFCEKADFVIRNGQLHWATGRHHLERFPEESRNPDLAGLPHIPDAAFIAELRGQGEILSPPESVWPVFRFTTGGLKSSAANGETVSFDPV